jgi:plasmid stability protein
MALDFDRLSPEELLAAESAVLTMRSLMDAVKSAPHGHGMERVESALHDKGFEHLRAMLRSAVASQEGAQKKGLAASRVPAANAPRSGGAGRRTS